ncbi:MAG: HD domain-containing protein [Burkholderiaceae bacterium]|nr:HD domain-containing protein [Aquabacterium sp.]NUP87884.1 HD domain-containing protein [Burkholderiaceae bacterium]
MGAPVPEHGITVLCAEMLARLKQALAEPDEATQALCDETVRQLAGLPKGVAVDLHIECLLTVAHIHYIATRSALARGPVGEAVELARSAGDDPLLRKALTFQGVIEMESGNLPASTTCFAEALQVAARMPSRSEAAVVWNNLGLALQRSTLHAEAQQCYEQAVVLADGIPSLAIVHRGALNNIASCALYSGDLAAGVHAAEQAVAMNPAPTQASDRLSRAISEANLARLLLQLGQTDAAAGHAQACVEQAEALPAGRCEFLSTLVNGMVAVHRGRAEAGLVQLKRALELARRHVPSEVGETLLACVDGYRRAGQADVALVYLHELLALNRRAREDQVVQQHREHVARLEASGSPHAVAAPDQHILSHRLALSGVLGDRDQVRQHMVLLEQQSVVAELHDDVTGEHCYRVGRLASLLAREIGLEEDVCFLIDLAARLHDIGKLAVPQTIMLKPARLDEQERGVMQTHTLAGAEILARLQLPQMHIAEEIARHHHEYWNGKGYPMGLARDAIPIAARVTALADIFDALTHARPYKAAWSTTDALAEVRRLRGQQFDPDLTDVFLALVPRLQREVGDLDTYLAAGARNSPFLAARRQIAAAIGVAQSTTELLGLRR